MTRLASCASAAVLMLAAGLSGPAFAQTSPLLAPPPANYSLDGNGVDLTSGQYMLSLTPVQIGQAGGPGIAYNRTFIRGLGWRDNVTGTLSSSGSTYYVSIGASTDVFTLSGSAFTPVRNIGQTLTLVGSDYIYTMPDGTTATFAGSLKNVLLPPPAPAPQMEANRGRLTQLRRPNGETLTYLYETARREIVTEPDWWVIRLRRVSSNYGYALDFTYEWDGWPDYDDLEAWRKLVTVTALNTATCSTPASCPGTVWPSATFSGNNITDQSGRTTYYSGSALRLPENPSTDAATITKDTNGRVITYSTGGGTWTYAYSVAGNELTVTITDPGSGVTVAKTDTTTGLLTSIRDPLNRTTSYQYDTSRRPTKITYPEGNSVSYAYDARGNVTTTTAEAPPASTEADIITSATYPATCANRVTCNQPTTTTDARGGVTNYEYDAVHGGVTRITLPAPASGAHRPETRIAYDERHAWLSNGSGGYTEVAAGVTLPVSISTCAEGSAPACVGTADEVRTTIAYGSAGAANNLHPTVVAQGAGDGSLTATNTLTWTNKGDVASVDGPLSGTGDTTTYRYDANRQVVGVIGPDPDGSGPLPRRAMRATYDNNGAATLIERGNVSGLADLDWAAFVSLQQAATTYDAYSRPTHQLLRSGSTTYGLSQVSYDTFGRTDCVVTRMNPVTFASPPASACSPATAGTFGPDRIVKHGYDAAGQLTSTTSGYGSDPITESVTYTDNGQPETLTDGEGNVSTFVYDGFDRLAQLRYPNPSGGGSSTTDYEAYTYDKASNVLTYRTRGGDVFTSTYDALGRQTAVDSPAGTPDFAYTYDNLGRTLTSVSNEQTLAWTWDALGRQTAETGALGTVYSQYDSAGRRTHLTWPGTPAFYVQYDYDVYGALTKVRENGAATGPGVLAAYTYDSLGRRTGAAFGNSASATWGYDNVGRMTSLAHNLAGSADDVSFTYAYNPANQIVQRTMSNAAYAWTPGAGSTAYQNNGRNQVTSVGGTAVGYDGNQNVASALGETYAYDDLNRLIGANPGSAATLAYDPAGRLERTTGATTTRFLYDGVQAIAEYNASGTLLRRHIPGAGLDQTIATLEGSGTTDRRWLAADERGSVMAISGGTAALLMRNRYDEYGVPASTNGGRFQYTGQMWIGEAGIYHYRARAYAPEIGRFVQTDPIGYAASANVYAYVGGDPVNLVDPLGQEETHLGEIIVTGQNSCPARATCLPGDARLEDIAVTGVRRQSSGGGGSRGGAMSRLDDVIVTARRRLQELRQDGLKIRIHYRVYPRIPFAHPTGIEICNCFVAGTQVMTVNGLRPIEEIRVGDRVLARGEEGGETEYKAVVALIAGSERDIWQVEFQIEDESGALAVERIGTTEEHRWRSVDMMWIETKDLAVGAQIITADGDRAVVLSSHSTGNRARTYNFEVEDFHTYFVGESGLWVHNECLRDALREMRRNRDFRDYAHRWKQSGNHGGDGAGTRNGDMTDSEILEAYEDWIQDGRPSRRR